MTKSTLPNLGLMLTMVCALTFTMTGCAPQQPDTSKSGANTVPPKPAMTPEPTIEPAPEAEPAPAAPAQAAPPVAVEIKIVDNSGLEAPYEGGLAHGWTKSGPSITVSEDTDDVYAGSASQRVETGDGYNFLACPLGDVSIGDSGLEAGGRYAFSFAIKVISGSLGAFRIIADEAPQLESQEPITDDAWTVHTFEFTAKSTASEAKIFFVNNADNPGTYLLDDVQIERID